MAPCAAASITLLESTKFSPLLHHPLSLRDRVCHQPYHACSSSIGQSFVLCFHRGTFHQVGFIPSYISWWVVGAFPAVVVHIIPVAEVWTIFWIVNGLESVGVGGASWTSSSALSCEHGIHIHTSTSIGSGTATTSANPTRCALDDLMVYRSINEENDHPPLGRLPRRLARWLSSLAPLLLLLV